MTQDSHKRQDLRIRRTRKYILAAFMDLTVQKGFEAVTVKDICEQAMINRATFYRHYLDKYDLVKQYMDELYDLLESTQSNTGVENPGDPPAGLVQMLKHVQKQADFYRVMLGPKGYPLFAERIRFYIEKRLHRNLATVLAPSSADQPPADMLLQALSNASLGAIQWWLENGNQGSPEQMAAWSLQLSRTIFNG